MLFKMTSKNKYPIPIKIKFSNINTYYNVSRENFSFSHKKKLEFNESNIVFFNSNLKFN